MAIVIPDIIEVLIPGPVGPASRVSISDDGTEVTSDVKNIDFSTNLTVTDEGDGNVRVASAGSGGGNLPTGGDINDILIKKSSLDGDATWERAAVGKYNENIEDYSIGDYVTYLSNLYSCIQNNPPAGTLPTDTDYWQDITDKVLLEVPITFWDSNKSDYSVNDKVTYLNGIYNCILDNPPAGTLPTDSVYWSVIGGDFSPVITTPEDLDLLIYDEDEGEWSNRRLLVDDIVNTVFTDSYPEGGVGSTDYTDMANVMSRIMQSRGDSYDLGYVDANIYNPLEVRYINGSTLEYQEIAQIISDPVNNVNGNFSVSHTAFTEAVSEGDALLITNVTPVDGSFPDDNDDAYTVSELKSDNVTILNRPILNGTSGYPVGWKIYKITYEFINQSVTENSYLTFTGQGQIGYPFTKQVVQPFTQANANRVLGNTIWTLSGQQDRPNYYGLEAEASTKERPLNLWNKGSSDNGLISLPYTYIYDGIRQNFTGIPSNREILLENYPVQNVFIVTNQQNYSLNDYPDSYVIRNFPITNFSGSTYDIVVLFGGVGTDPQFSQRPEFIPACKVCMDDSGVIQTVQDTVWVLDNGGYETKVSSSPEILSGLDVVDNGLATPPSLTQYSLTSSEVITGYKELIDTDYPDNISITQLWPDQDDRRLSVFTRDGRWYDQSATIPDPQEPNAKHALIPFGEFGVDFLFVYEKFGSYYDFLIVKGDRLYNAFDLVQGVEVPKIREPLNNGYIPVAALVQLGSGERGFHNIVDIKGRESGSVVSITTEEFLQDLSSKAQFRTESNTINVAQYSPELQGGDPTEQGWSRIGNITPEIDVIDGKSSLRFEFSSSGYNFIGIEPLRERLERLYDFGGSRNLSVRPLTDSNLSGETGLRILPFDDPRATGTVFVVPPDNPSSGDNSIAAIHDSESPDIVVSSNGGYIEWVHKYHNSLSVGSLFGSDGQDIALWVQFGDYLVPRINGVDYATTQFPLDESDVGKTIRVERTGTTLSYYKDTVFINSVTLPNANDWIITKMFSSNDITSNAQSLSISDVSFKESNSSSVKTYQMRTKLDRFEPNIPSDGNFNITAYNPSDWKADITEPGVEEQSMRLQWTTDGVSSTTFTLLADAGDQVMTFSEVGGYFDISLSFAPQNSGDWGLMTMSIVPPSGLDNIQVIDNIVWNYSGYLDPDFESWIRTGCLMELGSAVDSDFYLRDFVEETFTADATINVTAEDFSLGNIFFIEGDRDWSIVMPPITDQIDDLNTPNNSNIQLYFVGNGSYRVKRPDLSDDILIERTDSVQYAYTNYTVATVTCRDDFNSLGYVQYRVADLLQGDSAIIVAPPTAAEDVTYDPTGTPLTGTNVQSAITELATRAGTVDEVINLSAAPNTVINLSNLTIPADYITNPTIVLIMNGQELVKGVEWTRNSSTSFRVVNLDLVAGEDLGRYIIYPQ